MRSQLQGRLHNCGVDRGFGQDILASPQRPWSADGYRIVIIPVSEVIVVLYLVEVGDPDQADLIWIGPEADAAHLLPKSP